MSYSKQITEKVSKYKTFFADKSLGQIMVIIQPYTFSIDYSPLGQMDGKAGLHHWDFDVEAKEFMERQIRRLQYFIEYTKELDNDYIPVVTPGLGIGIHSAYYSGADIIFGEDTSWVHPVIHDWNDLDNLELNHDNKWFKLLKYMLSYSCDICDGSYVPGTHGHFAPADMANALRGNQLFYDFYDSPEEVHKLMDKSADAIVWLQKELSKQIIPVEAGSAVAGIWLPGDSLFMSEDAPDLCSPQIYTEFCRPYTQKVIDAVGGAYIHHHAKGEHVHNEIAKLTGLHTIEISWDPNCPRPIDHIVQIYEQNNGLPIKTRCTVADVYEKIDQIKQCRIILMLIINSLEEGREVMKFIRKHSKI